MAQHIVPKVFDITNAKEVVYDYAIFLDRYNLTQDHNNVPIKITGYEYQFHTLFNDLQVMYEDKYYNENTGEKNTEAAFEHATNLRTCAELLYHGITVFAVVELGENHGRILKIIPEKEIKNILEPEQYKTLIDLRDRHANYEERRLDMQELNKDIEYLKNDEDACVYTIKFDVIRYEEYQEIKQYLMSNYKRLDVDYGYPSTSMVKDKLRELERKKVAMLTPGVEAPHMWSLRKL